MFAENLEQSGNERRKELLLKAAGPISPDELQAREVFQAWRTEKTQPKNTES